MNTFFAGIAIGFLIMIVMLVLIVRNNIKRD